MEKKFSIRGTTDEVCTCDCCGRTDLKYTVIMDFDGEVSYFGKTCAARRTGMKEAEIVKYAKSADSFERMSTEADKRKLDAEEDAKFGAFLAARSSKSGRALQIEELGGFAAVRIAYAEVC